jgi:UDP-N-acetylmuramyl pentapeptide phosphotransferase/UDP-N-acetylglucosamine-1-phosphate transferase
MAIVLATWIAVALGTALVCWLACGRFASCFGWFADLPNARSLHCGAPLRLGGLCIVAVSLVAAGVLIAANHLSVDGLMRAALAGGLLMALVGAVDDVRPLKPLTKIVSQCAVVAVCAALALSHRGALPGSELLAYVPVAIGILWATNAFNFMDGADGLAGGMATVGFAAMACAAHLTAGAQDIALLAALISGAGAGFLTLNFPPARIFLGDAGSMSIGFLAAALSLIGTLRDCWPWWFGPIVFCPFLIDAGVTLAKRAVRGEKVWVAHREHYYQRLILSGWSHRRTCLAYHLLMLASALIALSAKNLSAPWMLLGPLVLTFATLTAVLEWRFRQEEERRKQADFR